MIMGTITIRKAERDDCARLMELVRDLALYEKAPEQVTVSLDHFTESGFGDSPVWWGYVAESNGHIHGFALYYIRYSTWKGQRMYLEDIYVEPAMFGQGIGAMLFETLIYETKRKGFSGMIWQVLDWNEPAKNFYRKYNATFDSGWDNCSIEF